MREQPLRLSCQKLSFILVFLFMCFLVFAQTKITILDESLQPLAGALVSIPDQELNLSSSVDGTIIIPETVNSSDQITIQFLSFQDHVGTLTDFQKVDFKIVMLPEAALIDGVVLVGRNQKYKADALLPVDIIGEKEMSLLQAQTPSDLLEKAGSVYLQKSQMGGGSPIIRGFEANKILLVVDGVRLNNAIYRSGHLQSSITLDEQAMKSVEVLFGPGSIIYGSEALGGVVHYRTKSPTLSQEKEGAFNLLGRYASSNTEKTLHLNYNFSSPKFAAYLSATGSDFGNLRAGDNYPEQYPNFGKRPDYVLFSDQPGETISDEIIVNPDPNVQVGTQYSQQDYTAKFKYQLNDHWNLVLNSQYSTSSNIPRYDRLIERDGDVLSFGEWYYGPQNRSLVSLASDYETSTALFDKVYVIAAHQKIKEDRISRNLGSQEREENFEALSVSSLTVDFNKRPGKRLDVQYGLDVQHNDLESTASPNIFTRYPNGGNTMLLYGLYARATYKITENWEWENGLRYAGSKIKLSYSQDNFFEWPSYFYNGIENTSSKLNYLGAINYTAGLFKASVLGGSAFRAPNIDDLAKIRVKADEITIANPDLKPETTSNLDLQMKYGNIDSYVGLSLFYVSLKDAIVRQDFQLSDGNPYYVNNGDSLRVVANVNAESAKVSGMSISGAYRFSSKMSVRGSVNYTDGTRKDPSGTNSPLGHIPPLYGQFALDYEDHGFNHLLKLAFNGKKDINDFGGSVDNPELATPEGSLSWYTLNYYVSVHRFNYIDIQAGLENILDKHYRPFSSGLSASGRNFILTLRTKF